MKAQSTAVLGPYKRYAIWVQGCNKRCIGCVSPDAQPLDEGQAVGTVELAADILSVSEIEGITISGGEPFLQQEALCYLIDIVQEVRDLGVILYTGFTYEEIADTELARRCDLIIDGEYKEELNDDRSLRGSSNQRVICITDRYKGVVDQYYGVPGRKVEFILNNQQINMVGIPAKHMLHDVRSEKQ